MAKTFLQLLNEVGKNLRRSTGATYTSVTQNGDVIFAGQCLNEAKRMVENRWKWSALRQQITFNSVGGQAEYDLTDAMVASVVARERAELLLDEYSRPLFWDVTAAPAYGLNLCTRDWALRQRTVLAQDVATPNVVAVFSDNDGLGVMFPYAPAGVRNYRLIVKNPQDDLALAADTLLVPWRPVVLAATAIAFDERGEELGAESNRWWERYEDALAEALGRESTAADFVLRSDVTYDTTYWKN